jgi:hypothetical protein
VGLGVATLLLPVAFWITPVAADDTVGLVHPGTGEWLLLNGGFIERFYFGDPGDFPMMGDWDCDGVDTPGLYRQSDGFVYLRNSNSQGIADIRFFFGNPGDIPLAGDFNADGCDTVSIYRAPEARIYVINDLGANDGGLGAADFSYVFGNPGDKPFVGDFDGDGVDTVGLHRESTGFVYFRNSHTQGNANNEFFFGDPGDRLVAGDWGVVDGTDTPALFRPYPGGDWQSPGKWYFRFTNTQGNADLEFCATFMWPEGIPVAGDIGKAGPSGNFRDCPLPPPPAPTTTVVATTTIPTNPTNPTIPPPTLPTGGWDPNTCTFDGIPMWGRVQVVDFLADVTIQEVTLFPDLYVQVVDFLPNSCGKWQEVSFLPDFTVQFVDFFPDLYIQYSNFPGPG